jgi:hypothetical protein
MAGDRFRVAGARSSTLRPALGTLMMLGDCAGLKGCASRTGVAGFGP